MTWLKKGSRLAQFAALAIVGGEFSAAMADVLVLRSVGPSARRYPAGQRVPDATRFTLRPGDSVVILARGGTRTFRGPGIFDSRSASRGSRWASRAQRRVGGVTRGPGGTDAPRPTDVWQLDVTQSGRACVTANTRPTLWRPSAESAVQLTITPQTGAPQTVTWARGQATLAWPNSIPVTDGASYQLNWTGAAAPTRLTARSIQPLPASDVEGLANLLVTNQCRGQLEVLIAKHDVDDTAGQTPSGGASQ